MTVLLKNELNRKIQERLQCLLLSVADTIATKTRETNVVTDSRNVIVLETDHAEIVNKMVAKKGVKEFLELTTAQFSQLQPRLRLFKNWVNKNKPDTEFQFASHFFGQNLFPQDGNYKYLGNVGIKNFEFINQGTDFATNYLYKCSIEMIFGNVEELTAQHIDTDGEKISFLDFLLPPETVVSENYYRIKAVLGYCRPDGPVNHYVNGTASDMLPEAINSYIDSWNFVMYLNRISYNFDFLEDGKITLKIDFISSLDRILESEESDILTNPIIREYHDIVKNLRVTMDNHETKLKTEVLPGVAKALGKDFSPYAKVQITNAEGKNEILDSDVELLEYVKMSTEEKDKYLKELNIESAQFVTAADDPTYKMAGLNVLESNAKQYQTIKDKLNEELDLRYQKIFAKLFDGGRIFYIETDLRTIFGSVMDNQVTFATSDDYIVTNEISISEAIKTFQKKWEGKVLNYSGQEINNSIRDFREAQQITQYYEQRMEDADTISKMAIDIRGATATEDARDIMSGDLTGDLSLNNNKIRIDFILFGDLIMKVFDILRENGAPLDHYAILLGNIGYKIEEKSFLLNIADIPISKQIFMDWYNSDIFDAKKTTLKIRDFLVAMLRKVLPAAISGGCFGENSRYLEEIEFKSFTVTEDKAKNLLKRPLSRYDLTKSLEGSQGTTFRTPQDVMDIIFIKSQDFTISDLSGDYEKDLQRGIYHFYIANNTGLVKKIKFNKVDDSNIIASNIQRAVESGINDVRTITTFYDANIEMIGNTLFTPGQIIYINPTFAGFGSLKTRRSIAKSIGIGGYYDVLEVKYKLDAGRFVTSIRAKWKGFSGEAYKSQKDVTEGREIYEKALQKSDENRNKLKSISEEIANKKESQKQEIMNNRPKNLDEQRQGSSFEVGQKF